MSSLEPKATPGAEIPELLLGSIMQTTVNMVPFYSRPCPNLECSSDFHEAPQMDMHVMHSFISVWSQKHGRNGLWKGAYICLLLTAFIMCIHTQHVLLRSTLITILLVMNICHENSVLLHQRLTMQPQISPPSSN